MKKIVFINHSKKEILYTDYYDGHEQIIIMYNNLKDERNWSDDDDIHKTNDYSADYQYYSSLPGYKTLGG